MIPRSIAIAASSVCIGFGAGYIVAERRLVKQFEERLEKETSEMKTFYTAHTRKKYETPQEAVNDLIVPELATETAETVAYHKVVKKQEYSPADDPEEELAVEAEIGVDGTLFMPGTVQQNVFESQPSEDKPYVISQDEYMQNDPEHDQSTLTYYADDTLSDERDEVIDDVERVTGEECFGQFGVGSSDEKVVHVRNNRLRMDFEVIRSDRTYAQDVLGVTE
jgi:hypothetical protein